MKQSIDSVLNEIRDRLIPDGIEKPVLFGSYASGIPTEDSDIDLLTVTADREMPKSFSKAVKNSRGWNFPLAIFRGLDLSPEFSGRKCFWRCQKKRSGKEWDAFPCAHRARTDECRNNGVGAGVPR